MRNVFYFNGFNQTAIIRYSVHIKPSEIQFAGEFGTSDPQRSIYGRDWGGNGMSIEGANGREKGRKGRNGIEIVYWLPPPPYFRSMERRPCIGLYVHCVSKEVHPFVFHNN